MITNLSKNLLLQLTISGVCLFVSLLLLLPSQLKACTPTFKRDAVLDTRTTTIDPRTLYYSCAINATTADRSCYNYTGSCDLNTPTKLVPFMTFTDCCLAIGATPNETTHACSSIPPLHYVCIKRSADVDVAYCQTETDTCNEGDTRTTEYYRTFPDCCAARSFTMRNFFPNEVEYCHGTSYYSCTSVEGGADRVCTNAPASCPPIPGVTPAPTFPAETAYQSFDACCFGIQKTSSVAGDATKPGYCVGIGNFYCRYQWGQFELCADDPACGGVVPVNRAPSYEMCCSRNEFMVKDTLPGKNTSYCHASKYYSCGDSTTVSRTCYRLPSFCGPRNKLFEYSSYNSCCTAIDASSNGTADNIDYCSSSATDQFYLCLKAVGLNTAEPVTYCQGNTSLCQFGDSPIGAYTAYSTCCSSNSLTKTSYFPDGTQYCHSGIYYSCAESESSTDRRCNDLPASCPNSNKIKTYTTFDGCCSGIEATRRVAATTSTPAYCSTAGKVCKSSWTPTNGGQFLVCQDTPVCQSNSLKDYANFSYCCSDNGYTTYDTVPETGISYCHSSKYYSCGTSGRLTATCYKLPKYCDSKIKLTEFNSYEDCCTAIRGNNTDSNQASVDYCSNEPTQYYSCNRPISSSNAVAITYCKSTPNSCQDGDNAVAAYSAFSTCCTSNSLQKRAYFPDGVEYCHGTAYYSCASAFGAVDRQCNDFPASCTAPATTIITTNFASYEECCGTIRNRTARLPAGSTPGYCASAGPVCSYKLNPTGSNEFVLCADTATCPGTETKTYHDFPSCCSDNRFTTNDILPDLGAAYCHSSKYWSCGTSGSLIASCYRLPKYCGTKTPQDIEYSSYDDCCAAIGSASDSKEGNIDFCSSAPAQYFLCTRPPGSGNNVAVSYCQSSSNVCQEGDNKGISYVGYSTCCSANLFTKKSVFPNGDEYCHSGTYYSCSSAINAIERQCNDFPASCIAPATTTVGSNFVTFDDCCSTIKNTSFSKAAVSTPASCSSPGNVYCSYNYAPTNGLQFKICADSTTCGGISINLYNSFSLCCSSNSLGHADVFPSGISYCHASKYYSCTSDRMDRTCFKMPMYCGNQTVVDQFNTYEGCAASLGSEATTPKIGDDGIMYTTKIGSPKYLTCKKEAGTSNNAAAITYCQNKVDSCQEGDSAVLAAYVGYSSCCSNNSFSAISYFEGTGTQYCTATPYYSCASSATATDRRCNNFPTTCSAEEIVKASYSSFGACCSEIRATTQTDANCTTPGSVCSYKWMPSGGENEFLLCGDSLTCSGTPPLETYKDYGTCCSSNNLTVSDVLPGTGTSYCHASKYYACTDDYMDRTCYHVPLFCGTQTAVQSFLSYEDCCKTIINSTASTNSNGIEYCSNTGSPKYFACISSGTSILGFTYCWNTSDSCRYGDSKRRTAYIDFSTCCNINRLDTIAHHFSDRARYCHGAKYYTCKNGNNSTERRCYNFPSTCLNLQPENVGLTSYESCCDTIGATSFEPAISGAPDYCWTPGRVCNYYYSLPSKDQIAVCANNLTCPGNRVPPQNDYKDFDTCCHQNGYNATETFPGRSTFFCHNSKYWSCGPSGRLTLMCYQLPAYCDNNTKLLEYNSYNDCCTAISLDTTGINGHQVTYCSRTPPEYFSCSRGMSETNGVQLTYCQPVVNSCQGSDERKVAYPSYSDCCTQNSLSQRAYFTTNGAEYCHAAPYYSCAARDRFYCIDSPALCKTGEVKSAEFTTYQQCCVAIGSNAYANETSYQRICLHLNTPTVISNGTSTCGHSKYYGQTNSPGVSIIGGTTALPNQFPWMVRLTYVNGASYIGIIIDEQYVIAYWEIFSGTNASDWTAHFGDWRKDDYDDGEFTLGIENVTVQTSVVAVARLSSKLNFNSSWLVQKICLQSSCSDGCAAGTIATAAGWGSTTLDPNSLSNYMNTVQLPILNTGQCEELYSGEDFTATWLCTDNSANTRGVGPGDNGAPLMTNENGPYTLCGLGYFQNNGKYPRFLRSCYVYPFLQTILQLS